MYEIDRLKTSIWVQAQIQLCQQQHLPMMVVRKGHEDAGMVIVKQDLLNGHCHVWMQQRDHQGKLVWMEKPAAGPVTLSEADKFIERQISFDEDLWLIEVEDPKSLYHPEDIMQ
ncbi:MAG: hypothetical protein CMF31_03725 [Kordiimonas sp.]|nr:hypothetical protein [Kordiimonas sp.]|tara:strand:- start:848 stop:1189 length:342 start_codon:yes stop_codon:yes gene_type:complete